VSMKKKHFLNIFAAVLTGVGSAQAADAVYQNDGIVNSSDYLQIDAITFINNGIFSTPTSFFDFPYETQNTLYYTNRGLMRGIPGFRFSTVNQFGRRPASVVNNQGEIEGIDTPLFGAIIGGGSAFFNTPASKIELMATNIINRGLLSAGEGGIVKLQGRNLNISRGGIRTGPSPSGQQIDLGGVVNTNFHINSPGIFDRYWAQGTNQVLGDPAFGRPIQLQFPGSGFDLQPTLNPAEPFSPLHEVFFTGFNSDTSVRLNQQIPVIPASISNQFAAFAQTNFLAATTNAINQVVFINTNVSQGVIQAGVRWLGLSPIVRLSFTEFDPVLEANIESTLFIIDDMLVSTNRSYTTNLVTGTGRPNNYSVFRSDFGLWNFADNGNTRFSFLNQIWNPFWVRNVVTNLYSAYSFAVNQDPGGQSIFIPDNVFGAIINNFTDLDYGFGAGFGALTDATNLQGRVEVKANGTLDARFARLRGQNYMSVEAAHFISNPQTVLDAPIMSLNLSSTNGTLGITNLIPASVGRFIGQINLYSAVWTNLVVTFDPFDPANTNTVAITTHVLIVDDTVIDADSPVEVQSVRLKADNLVLENDLNVTKGLVLDGTNVTLNSSLIVRGVTDSIRSTNFPSLQNLEINNSFLIGDTADFGSPGKPLKSFVNNGVFAAYTANIYADYFKGGGTFITGGGFGVGGGPSRIAAGTMDLELATFLNGGDMTLIGTDLLAAFSSLRIGDINVSVQGQEFVNVGKLTLSFSGNVDDGGAGANNNWRVTDGFHLLRVPASGDFMGTRLTSRAGRFREVHHTWAGVDRGASADGFNNNAALGRLVLSGQRLPLFVFDTINGNNALYVDFLQLDGAATNALLSLDIKPGMKIYFANANLPVGDLDGLFADDEAPAGRLRHVPRGSATSTTVVVNGGQAGGITAALLASDTIDSDGDGIPNAQDPTPFDGVAINVELLSGNDPAAKISWNGAARTEYQVQYRNTVADSGWETLTNVITGNATSPLSVHDPVGAAGTRFYRVLYSP
jgi:hypothetical protein